MKRFLVIAITAAFLSPCFGSFASAQQLPLAAKKGSLFEQLFLFHINQHRRTAGKPALKIDERISSLARDVALGVSNGTIALNSNAIRGQRAAQRFAKLRQIFGAQTTIGENFQPTGTPESVPKTWMSHNNERGRMLGDANLVGLGVAVNAKGVPFYAAIFVTTKGSKPPQPQKVQITVRNATNDTVIVHKLNAAGRRIQPSNLAPKNLLGFALGTPIGERFVVTDKTGKNVLLQFTVTKKQDFVVRQAKPPQPNLVQIRVFNQTNQTVVMHKLTAQNRRIQPFNISAKGFAGRPGGFPVGDRFVVTNQAGNKVLLSFTVTKKQDFFVKAAAQPPAQKTIRQLELETTEETNKVRRKLGLKDLRFDDRVSKIARTWSQAIANAKDNNRALFNQMMSQSQPGAPKYATAGHWDIHKRAKSVHDIFGTRTIFRENVNPTGTPQSVVNFSWTNSKGHFDNQTHRETTVIGIGIARDRKGDLYYTAIYLKPQFPNGIKKGPLTAVEQKNMIKQVLDGFNKARQDNRLAPAIRTNGKLTKVAQDWAALKAGQNAPANNLGGATAQGGPFDKSGYRWRDVAETAALDQPPAEAVNRWLNNNANVRNWILKRAQVEVGIGVFRTNAGKLYWSVVFAVPQ